MGGQQNNMSRVPHNMPMQNYIPPQNNKPPQNNMPPQNYTPQQHNYIPPQNNMPPHNNTGGWSNDMPGNMQHNIQNEPANGGYQGGPSNYHNKYPPSQDAV
jgi:hypothetical protein